jgi:hypothetical protein
VSSHEKELASEWEMRILYVVVKNGKHNAERKKIFYQSEDTFYE